MTATSMLYKQVASRDKRIDALALTTSTAIGMACTWHFRFPWFWANFVVLGIPLCYLLMRAKTERTYVSPGFTLLFIVFGAAVMDYLNARYHGWSGPTLLPFRFPGGVSFEEVQYIALYFPLILMINEHFWATRVVTRPNYLAKWIMISLFYFGIVFVMTPRWHASVMTYVYLKSCLITQLPFILLGVWVNRWIVRELLLIGIVTGAFNLAFEVIALRNGYWQFPGEYVGYVGFLQARFPVEELAFLILLSGPSIVSTHAIYKNWIRRRLPP